MLSSLAIELELGLANAEESNKVRIDFYIYDIHFNSIIFVLLDYFE